MRATKRTARRERHAEWAQTKLRVLVAVAILDGVKDAEKLYTEYMAKPYSEQRRGMYWLINYLTSKNRSAI